jgi:hypothetical protein
MGDEIHTDVELERLQSMRDRVEKLRSQLKDIRLDTYAVVGTPDSDEAEAAAGSG